MIEPELLHSHRVDEPGAGTKVSHDVSALLRENSNLREKVREFMPVSGTWLYFLFLSRQLSEVSFELAHQKVQWQGKLAEAERKASLVEEESQAKVKGGM